MRSVASICTAGIDRMIGIGLVMAVGVLLAACDQRAMIAKMTPEAEYAYAKHFVELAQNRDITAVEQDFPNGLLTDAQRQQIPSLISSIPVEPPNSIVIEGVQIHRSPEATRTEFVVQYEFSKKWLLISMIVLQKAGAGLQMERVNIAELPGSFSEVNAFRFDGKPLPAYLVAGATLATISFVAISLGLCLLSRRPRWKWKAIWCLAMFVGVGHVIVEWTGGHISFAADLSWFSASIGRLGPDGPYYFETVLPVGAIAYWIWRQTLRESMAVETRAGESN